MTSLREIAAACGVSVSTASIALRGVGQVSADTRRRVLAAAKKLGYAPDPMAARLSSRRFSQAATARGLPLVITSDEPHDPRQNRIVTPLETRAHELGYQTRVEPLPVEPRALRATLRRWRQTGVAGIVFVRLQSPLPLELQEWSHFALVACETLHPPPCHRVTIDVGEAVATCWRVLREKGYRTIGLAIASHRPRIKDDLDRLASALLLHELLPGSDRRVPIFSSPLSESTPAALRDWFAQNRPDAVIGFTTAMRYWISEGGWRCPEDFAFATLHHIPHQPEISGYDTQMEARARFAVELADQLVRHRQTGWPATPHRTVMPSGWVEGITAPRKPR